MAAIKVTWFDDAAANVSSKSILVDFTSIYHPSAEDLSSIADLVDVPSREIDPVYKSEKHLIALKTDVEDRISEHNQAINTHADIRSLLNSRCGLPSYDPINYKLSFATSSGATAVIDLPIEQLSLHYDTNTKEMWFINPSGSETRIPLVDFIDIYTGKIGSMIQITVSEGNVISATLLDSSITKTKLSAELQSEITGKINAQGGNASWAESVANRATFTYDTPLPGSSTLQAIGNWFGRIAVKIEHLFAYYLRYDSNGSSLESYHQDDYPYNESFPAPGQPWPLYTWFSLIRTKIDRLFVVSPTILNVTATRSVINADWVFDAFDPDEFYACINNTLQGKTIKIHFKGFTGQVNDVDKIYDCVYNGLLEQIECIELARAFYVSLYQPNEYDDLIYIPLNRGSLSYASQQYLDLGAVFNAQTGYYDFLGLTNITESECRESYYLSAGMRYNASVNFRDYAAKTRFLFPISSATSTSLANAFWKTSGIQRVRLCARQRDIDGINNLFLCSGIMGDAFAQSSVVWVEGGINISLVTSAANLLAFTNTNMQHILLYGLKVNLNLSSSSSIDDASILFAIVYRLNGTTNITMILHPAAYARVLLNTAIQTALINSNITIASA